MEHKQQIAWINGAKFVAILAVMTDHTNRILYTNPDIIYASNFSVSLLIILSGMTSYLANMHHITSSGRVTRSCKKILTAYCIAVIIYMIVMTHGFDFLVYLHYLVYFNISGPYYFVLLYIQLMVVSGFLFNLLQRCPESGKGYICEALIMLGIIILSIWTTNYTNILNVYGGGGKLFGGTYLILFYFGMLAMKHGWLENTTITKSAAAFVLPGILWFIVWRYTCLNGLKLDTYMPFAISKNPPSITCMTFGLCMLFITFGMFTLLEQIKHVKNATLFVCELGRHSLYIFLYHKLILDYFLVPFMSDLISKNIWVARIIYFTLMIVGSVLIEIIIVNLLKTIKWVYTSNKDNITVNT